MSATSIGLPWTTPLTQNQLRRMHHHLEAATKRRMSDEARWTIRAEHPEPFDPPVTVTLHYRPATRRVCDSDGIAPTLKIALDALVREGLLPGDDWRYVTATTQRIHPPLPGMPAGMWLTIREDRP
ncbi:MAG TPA: hypothetical protein VFJ14_06765 [Nocardioidaceae bacterium]|nr:hypothetical protein [Nocardioidaceae bacterium]